MANRGDGSITYTWEAPDDIGGTAITKYEYRHYQTGTADADIPDWTSASLRTGAAFPNLDAAQTYDFDVRAVNAVGAGPATIVGRDAGRHQAQSAASIHRASTQRRRRRSSSDGMIR